MDMFVLDCFDSIAIFLSIHIVYRFQEIMHKRKVPALDKWAFLTLFLSVYLSLSCFVSCRRTEILLPLLESYVFWYLSLNSDCVSWRSVSPCRYWDTLLEIMWPRFEYLLQMNIQSIRDCDPQKLGQIDVRPHYVSVVCLCRRSHNWFIKDSAVSFVETKDALCIGPGPSHFEKTNGPTVHWPSFLCRSLADTLSFPQLWSASVRHSRATSSTDSSHSFKLRWKTSFSEWQLNFHKEKSNWSSSSTTTTWCWVFSWWIFLVPFLLLLCVSNSGGFCLKLFASLVPEQEMRMHFRDNFVSVCDMCICEF